MRAVAGIVQIRLFITVMLMATAVSTGFRLERRFALADGTAEATQHFSQDVVSLKAQLAAPFSVGSICTGT